MIRQRAADPRVHDSSNYTSCWRHGISYRDSSSVTVFIASCDVMVADRMWKVRSCVRPASRLIAMLHHNLLQRHHHHWRPILEACLLNHNRYALLPLLLLVVVAMMMMTMLKLMMVTICSRTSYTRVITRFMTIRYDTQVFNVRSKNWQTASLVYHTRSVTKRNNTDQPYASVLMKPG